MTQWIGAITRGHNGGAVLLKDGEIVFAIEEERLTRKKYDGGPLAAMTKFLDYTDRLDYLVVAHTQPLAESSRIDFSGGDMYTGLARKLGLIDRDDNAYTQDGFHQHRQVIDLSHIHHKLHAACAFYRSGFEDAVALIVDGAGTFIPMNIDTGIYKQEQMTWECESIFSCSYPDGFKTLYKHQGGNGPYPGTKIDFISSEREGEEGYHQLVLDDTAGIVKAYEAVTQYCGFAPIEAGKTMGLSPYGKACDKFPKIYTDGGGGKWRTTDKNFIIPTYPNAAVVNDSKYEYLETTNDQQSSRIDLTTLENRRDLAYAVQTESQEEVLRLIMKSVEMSGNKNVVLSGGYALNCVANYFYLDALNKEGIKLYVEPVSNDAGTAIGAALLQYHQTTKDKKVRSYAETIYEGFTYDYSLNDISKIAEKYGASVEDTTNKDIVELIKNKNIVTIFQGKSENGPRALGNRSILFDPTFEDGKDFVNRVKRREYFRPFAGTILLEHAHDWFDMKGMDQSPHMMYAMDCKEGVAEKIPSIIHVDGTCRIQTVTQQQNENYYNLIKEFYDQTGVPIIFNTSFNLGGEPLVETLDDAVRTLYKSEMEYCFLPEFGKLIVLKN
jgi:carbamoyltransferase